MKILIVEDNIDLSADLKIFLSSNGFLCESAFSLSEAKDKLNFYEDKLYKSLWEIYFKGI